MSEAPIRRSGGQWVAAALAHHGIDTAFGVPGESYLAVLDGLHDVKDKVRFVVCRQEGGAANMADAYGKLTGRPAALMVTRGPGAANATVGVHTAFQDSTPMLVLIGQVGRSMRDREAFQEMDFRKFYSEITKWTAEIDDPARVPEYIARALTIAVGGRPGPVALALPEDMLRETAAAPLGRPVARRAVRPHPGEMERLRGLLADAGRPLVIAGGPGWNAQAAADLQRFAEANEIAVACAFRRQDSFDNRHRLYAGDVGIATMPKLADRIRAADLLLVVGPRLGEMTTAGYSLIKPLETAQTLIHIHPGAEELGRVYQPDLAIQATLPEACAALADLAPLDAATWARDAAQAHRDYLDYYDTPDQPSPVDLGQVMAVLRDSLPADTIMANGASSVCTWLHKFWPYAPHPSQLGPTSGAMGYGVPAAVAAALVHPDRQVVAIQGDGCFLMNGQELATAVQYGAKPLILIFDNASYGTIRMHQETQYPGRVIGTDLANPDFAAMAEAFGAHGETVAETDAFAPALERARAAGKAAVIHVKVAVEAIAPRRTLSAIRALAENAG